MGMIDALRRPSTKQVTGWAWVSLTANILIVLTGGTVRLTESGLGCPTWPRCTEDSFVPRGALGMHEAIEFGNRMLTYVLVAVSIGTLIAVYRWTTDRRFRWIALGLAAGIPLQAVIGGITVLTGLNPWIVSLHLILSMCLIAMATVLLVRVRDEPIRQVSRNARRVVLASYVVLWVAIYLGTVVTGSGPHAGDATAERNGLDPQVWSHIHAGSVYLLVVLSVALCVMVRGQCAMGLAVAQLFAVLAQGLIGIVQYLTDLPVALVAMHLLGAALLASVATRTVALTQAHAGT